MILILKDGVSSLLMYVEIKKKAAKYETIGINFILFFTLVPPYTNTMSNCTQVSH